MPRSIFISYRRDDSAGHTGRLYDRLIERLGAERVFLDIDNIPPGLDFVDAIDRTLDQCQVVIVVIGPRWLQIQAPDGTRRIDSDTDFHRLEIERSLDRGMRVIPVLVGASHMPQHKDLPGSLHRFARRNAFEISDRRFNYDAGRLADVVEAALSDAVETYGGVKESVPSERPPVQHETASRKNSSAAGGALNLKEVNHDSDEAVKQHGGSASSEKWTEINQSPSIPKSISMGRRTLAISAVATFAAAGYVAEKYILRTPLSSGGVVPDPAAKADNSPTAISVGALTKKYVVGIDAAYPPFEFQDSTGEIKGFSVELMSAIADRAGFQVMFANTPWEYIFNSLAQGDRDILISSITVTDERKKTMEFSDSYFSATQLIVVPRSSGAARFEEIKRLSIGVQTGTTGDEFVTGRLGKTSSRIKRFESTQLALLELEAGKIDAVVADNGLVLYFLRSRPTSALKTFSDNAFTPEPYGIATRKGDAKLIELINNGLATIRKDGTYSKLFNRYFV